MVIIVFLQWVHLTDELVKISPATHDPQILEKVYTDVFYPFPNEMIHFAFETGVLIIVAETRYLHVLAHTAILCTSEVDWSKKDCCGWYSYNFWTVGVREVPPTHRGGCNNPDSKPRAREDGKVSKLIDIKTIFDARVDRDRKRLAEAMATPVDKVSPSVPPSIEEASPVVQRAADSMETEEISNAAPNKKLGGKSVTVDSLHC